MATNCSIILEGVLKADGTLELQSRPQLPPGRVRVKLELLPQANSKAERMPDLPWPDDTIPAPFDLPRPRPQRVDARAVNERLPDPLLG